MLYKKTGSKFFWMAFTFDRKRIQKSTRTANRKAAEEIEAGLRVQLAKGTVGLADRPHLTVAECLDKLQLRWEDESKDGPQNLSLLKKTRADWGTRLAETVTDEDLERYQRGQRKQGYAVASVNRTFQCLRRAFKLAKVPWPSFEMQSEKANRRKGFLQAAQMEKVLANLPDDGLRDFVRFAYSTGIRKGEVTNLRWSFLQDGQIIVPGEFCKSGEPHCIPVAGPLAAILERRGAARAVVVNGTTSLCEYIFHRNGLPVREFRKTWKSATKAAGVGNLLFHDLRRSGVRDLIRSGAPQSVAMAISGHRTAAVFERYNIVTGEDTAAALERMAKYRAG